MNNHSQDSLKHYGVLGMKWRHRKSKATSTTTKPKLKSVSEMSDEELRSKINRLEMEKRYKDLQPKQVKKGKLVVNRIMKNMVAPAAEDLGKQLIKSILAKQINTKMKLGDEFKVHANNKKK